jgi:alcohol dehydrogenase class IV
VALFDWQPRTRVLFGAGTFGELGARARELNTRHTLLVCDAGIVSSGYAAAARASLEAAGIRVSSFHDFAVNPDSRMIEAGRDAAAALDIDSLVALGGGSSLDCAKGINLLLTNGGAIPDYRGYGKAPKPMLPMIGIPTTAGTGSEAQSYAVIADAETHLKMACGDPKLAFAVAILDPALTWSQPPSVTVATGFDAMSHAVESFVTAKRSPVSDMLAREAWRLIDGNLERVIAKADDADARAAMLLGAHYAGAAIEQSMLGAAHACANPLTARYDITHGIAVALMLPSVVRWNATVVGSRYQELLASSAASRNGHAPTVEEFAKRLEDIRRACGFPGSLEEAGVPAADLESLARDAAPQWTGTFNPRPFDEGGALELYRKAF